MMFGKWFGKQLRSRQDVLRGVDRLVALGPAYAQEAQWLREYALQLPEETEKHSWHRFPDPMGDGTWLTECRDCKVERDQHNSQQICPNRLGLFTRALLEEMSPVERALRTLLAYQVAPTTLYTDDGELSDASKHPAIDFLRDTPEQIQEKFQARIHKLPV